MDSKPEFLLSLDIQSIHEMIENPPMDIGFRIDEEGLLHYHEGSVEEVGPLQMDIPSSGSVHLPHPFRKANLKFDRFKNCYSGGIVLESHIGKFYKGKVWRELISPGLRVEYGVQYEKFPCGGYITSPRAREPLISIDASLNGVTVMTGKEGTAKRSMKVWEEVRKDMKCLEGVANTILHSALQGKQVPALTVILGL